jgi:hypothetical protein
MMNKWISAVGFTIILQTLVICLPRVGTVGNNKGEVFFVKTSTAEAGNQMLEVLGVAADPSFIGNNYDCLGEINRS